MFWDGNLFWFLMGLIFILVGAGFKAFVEDRGWVLNWWKGLLAAIWYWILMLSIYAGATLTGENEGSAGLKLFLFGLVISIILGVGLWRLLAAKPKAA
jgi:hypothetical protein